MGKLLFQLAVSVATVVCAVWFSPPRVALLIVFAQVISFLVELAGRLEWK